jgi:hypothetical protein
MTTMSSAAPNSSNGTQAADSSDALAALDTSDVPRVGARELALALKMLSGRGLLFPSVSLSDDDLRRVEQAFWQISRRGRQRKVAVLLRFRSLMEACQSRRINDLIARHGQEAVVKTLEIAAGMRLNVKWGFNPHKLARAVSEALESAGESYLPRAHAAA